MQAKPVKFGMSREPNLVNRPKFIDDLPSADAVGLRMAEMVRDQLRNRPNTVFIFLTGKTPATMYKYLCEMTRRGEIDWSQAHLFHLDEYEPAEGVREEERKQLYRTFAEDMDHSLWGLIKEKQPGANLYYFKDYSPKAYRNKLLEVSQGRPLITIAGIGPDEHIAFNMPGPDSHRFSTARYTDLNETTLRTNFKQDLQGNRIADPVQDPRLPKKSKTLGIGDVMRSDEFWLVALKGKEVPLRRAFNPETPASSNSPASWLKAKHPAADHHPKVTVFTDFPVFNG